MSIYSNVSVCTVYTFSILLTLCDVTSYYFTDVQDLGLLAGVVCLEWSLSFGLLCAVWNNNKFKHLDFLSAWLHPQNPSIFGETYYFCLSFFLVRLCPFISARHCTGLYYLYYGDSLLFLMNRKRHLVTIL